MCCGCWQEAGSPKIYNAQVQKGIALVDRIYEYSMVGGPLHIVVDDMNVDDHSLGYCLCLIDNPPEFFYHDWSPELLAICRETHNLFYELTEEERYSVLAIRDGCFDLATDSDAKESI